MVESEILDLRPSRSHPNRGRGPNADQVEVIPFQKVNEAYERLQKSDVKYRFSIDMWSLNSE